MQIDEGAVIAPKPKTATPVAAPFVSPEVLNQQPVGAYTEVSAFSAAPAAAPAAGAAAAPFVSPEVLNQQPVGAYTIVPLDPPKPSLLDRIGSVGSAILSPFENVAKLGLDAVETEVKQLISSLTDYVKTHFTSVYDFIDTSVSELKNSFGTLISTAKNDIKGWVSDVHSYAAHLFDTVDAKIDSVATTMSNDVKSLEHKTAADISSALKGFEPTVSGLISKVLHPITNWIDNSEIWFNAQWHKYAGDVVDFVHSSEHWIESRFKQYTHNIEGFIGDPVKWLEDNWKHVAGDLTKWLDPAPLNFLSLLPQVLGWFEWLAANPLEIVTGIAHEFRTPSSYDQAIKRLNDNKYDISSAAVERFRRTL